MILQVENAGNVWEGNHTLPKFNNELTPEKWWLGNYTFLFGGNFRGYVGYVASGVYGWDLKSQDYKYLFNLKLLISTKFSGGYTWFSRHCDTYMHSMNHIVKLWNHIFSWTGQVSEVGNGPCKSATKHLWKWLADKCSSWKMEPVDPWDKHGKYDQPNMVDLTSLPDCGGLRLLRG